MGGEVNAAVPYRIGYSRQGGLLRAHVIGVNGSLETTLAYWNELAREIRRLPPRELLGNGAIGSVRLADKVVTVAAETVASVGDLLLDVGDARTEGGGEFGGAVREPVDVLHG